MTEEDITIKIKADTSDFAQGMDEATKKTEDFAKTTEKASDATKNFKGISGAADKVTSIFKGFSELKGGNGKRGGLGGIFDGLKSKFMSVGMSAKVASAGAIGVIIAGIGLAGKLLVDLGKKIFQIAGNLSKMYDSTAYERATSKMNESITKMKTTLGAIMEPIYQFMTGVIGTAADVINAIAEALLKAYAYFVGFIGLSGTLAYNADSYAESMEEATSSANAGLASFDKLTTLDTSGMGDASQTERIKEMMSEAALSAESMRASIWEAINPMKAIANMMDNLDISSKWNGFVEAGKNAWEKIADGARSVWGSITAWVSDTFTSIFTIDWSGVFNGIVGAFKGVLNSILALWNNSVGNISVGFDVPLIGHVGFDTYGLKIPYLAHGTVADPNDPFLAVIGDNNREREVVSPLSTIEDAVRNVIGEGGGKQTIELTVNLDGRKIARGTYDYLASEARRRGQSWQ